MDNILKYEVEPEGFRFCCESQQEALSIQDWGKGPILLPSGKPGSVAPLFSWIEEEEIETAGELSLLVPHPRIARMDAFELKVLGLPPQMPYVLHLESEGNLTDRDFRFNYRLQHRDTRPVVGYKRNGALLEVGNNSFVIPDPQYTLLVEIERYNQNPIGDVEPRFQFWGRLKEILPDDVFVGGYLKSIQVVTADCFSVNPIFGTHREVTFSPVLKKRPFPEAFGGPVILESEPPNALPPEPQRTFSRQFGESRDARSRYAVGRSWYVIVPEKLKRALSVARQILDEDQATRKEFLKNPRAMLRERLGSELPEEVLEDLFVESDDYSDRVREIGIWQPPVIPFFPKVASFSIPEEEFGIRVGDQLILVRPNDVSGLIANVQSAIEAGKSCIEYAEHRVPATKECLDALMKLQDVVEASTQGREPGIEKSAEAAREPIVLIPERNLDELDYSCSAHAESRPGTKEIPSLQTDLLSHQSEGLGWLQEHWLSGSRGALLADDMGLGKTLQTLAFLLWIRKQMNSGKYPGKPFLIVAPTGLLKNWRDEHDCHIPEPGLGHPVEMYGDGLRARRMTESSAQPEMTTGIPILDMEEMKHSIWALTTYETLRDYQHSFGRIRWGVVVFDETQKIKNPKALMTDAAKAMNADFTVALTGTPVENRLTDLWCIVDTIQPGKLGSLKHFVESYESEAQHDQQALHKLKEFLTLQNPPTVMLRRMKEDHLNGLPEKREIQQRDNMSNVQAEEYRKTIMAARANLEDAPHFLEILHKLRSISLHPFRRSDESDEEYIRHSARLRLTFSWLDEIAARNQKALVFIEARSMQGDFAELIQRRYSLEKRPLIINGAVAGNERKKRVDIFQKRRGFDVMILSPKAGGVGLTLTAANHVIHLSRWWNPAVEDQCTDRVYRIGQERPVNVYLPIAVHPEYQDASFDVRLDELLKRKRHLNRTILAPPGETRSDAEQLFKETVVQH